VGNFKFLKIILIITFLISLRIYVLPQRSKPTILNEPKDWLYEKIEFPLSFAPNIIGSQNMENKVVNIEDIEVLFYQKIPLRDGVNLSANIFKPEKMSKPLPAIMVLTPYVSDHNVKRGEYFSKNGYVFVSVDCRGRGNSEGIFTPFENEGKDGYDAVEWIARQSWCNGKVGTMGGSYKGMDQWLIAKENPPHLTSMAPTATVCPGIDATRDRNIYRTYNLSILSFVSGRTLNPKIAFSKYTMGKIKRYYMENEPYSNLLDALKMPDNNSRKVFKRWINHPTFDAFWKNILPSAKDFEEIKIPILSITGYFDDDQPGHMYYYSQFLKNAKKTVKNKIYFVVGPWDHSGTRRPKANLGGLKFGNQAAINILKLHKQWFDWTMKNGDKPDFLKDRITYFHMGPNKWDYRPSYKELSDKQISFYLSSPQGNPNNVYTSGTMKSNSVNDKNPDLLIYDPLKPAFKDDYQINNDNDDYFTNSGYLSEKGWLYYHSEILKKDIDIAGYPLLKAFVEIDAPDTDFYYKLFEIKPNGKSVYISNGIMRARFRNSLAKEELVKPGSINGYDIKSLNLTVYRISKGSRLRLLFGYLDSQSYQKNYNTGGDVSLENGENAKTVKIKLHMNKKYPTVLVLPIIKSRK